MSTWFYSSKYECMTCIWKTKCSLKMCKNKIQYEFILCWLHFCLQMSVQPSTLEWVQKPGSCFFIPITTKSEKNRAFSFLTHWTVKQWLQCQGTFNSSFACVRQLKNSSPPLYPLSQDDLPTVLLPCLAMPDSSCWSFTASKEQSALWPRKAALHNDGNMFCPNCGRECLMQWQAFWLTQANSISTPQACFDRTAEFFVSSAVPIWNLSS